MSRVGVSAGFGASIVLRAKGVRGQSFGVDRTNPGLDDAQGVASQVFEGARISGYVLDPTRLKGR
jgi:hypothetical protein